MFIIGDSGRDGGDSRDDANGRDDTMEENMEDEDKDACNAMPNDLSSIIVLKHPSQPGEWEGDHNTADRNLQSNAHSSSSLLGHHQLIRHQHQYCQIQDATADWPCWGPA